MRFVINAHSKTETPQEVADIVADLTFEEKVALLGGNDTWHFGGVPRLGIAPLRAADCGHGITLVDEGGRATTCLPTAMAMGATWDRELIRRAGELLGRESRALGVGLLLGPMINLQRLPVGGRNFEAFSEDPILTAELGGALIRGIQGTGTGACAKHLAGYAQIRFSRTHSAEIEDSVLRGLYLRHFARVVRKAKPAAVMTSYNRVNGEHSAACRELLRGFLREELGYGGLVLSDWGGVHGPEVIAAGLDLEMPGPPRHVTTETMRAEVACGALSMDELDAAAARVLDANLCHAVRPDQIAELDSPAHRQLAREVAEGAITLLRNEGDLLPLEPERLRRVAVIGPNAATARLGGSGSASVTPAYSISPLAGLRARLGETVEIVHAEGCPAHGEGAPVRARLRYQFFNDIELSGPEVARGEVEAIDFTWGWAAPMPGVRRGSFGVRFEGELTSANGEESMRLRLLYEAGGARVWLDGRLVHDNWDPAGNGLFEDRYGAFNVELPVAFSGRGKVGLRVDFRQLASGSALRLEHVASSSRTRVDEAVALARSADVVIVCAGLCNRFEGGGGDRPTLELPAGQDALIEAVAVANHRTVVVLNGATAMAMPWLERVAAVLHAYYPGQEGGAALARILCGDVSPSGRLPVTLPRCLEDVPGMAFYPGDEDRVVFGERLLVGYRHYVSHRDIEPLFPFGFGITYSVFNYSWTEVSADTFSEGESVIVSVRLTNVGARTAAEVVQLYAGPGCPEAGRPAWELCDFAKVTLAAGEARRVEFRLSADTIARYCGERSAWVTDPGEYVVRIGPDCLRGGQRRLVFLG